jgi:hypothetical protein
MPLASYLALSDSERLALSLDARVLIHGFRPDSNLGRTFSHLLSHLGAAVKSTDLYPCIHTVPTASSLSANVSSNIARFKRAGYRISNSPGYYRLESEVLDPAFRVERTPNKKA